MSRLCSVYCSPRKRARVCAPYPITGLEPDRVAAPSIDTLPDECLFEIFRHVTECKDRSILGCVSKHWLFLLGGMRKSDILKTQFGDDQNEEASMNDEDDDGYLSRCLEGKKATDVRLAAIAVGISGRSGLGKLSIRGNNSARGVTTRGVSSIARSSPSLRTLSLWDVDSIRDETLSEISIECRSLEKLDLNRCPRVSSKGLIAIAENCPNLKSVSIELCPRIGNEALEAIGRSCPNLESISIKDCPLVGDRGVASLVASWPCSLTKVKLHGLDITDFTLAAIGHYGKSITNLVLAGLKSVTEKGFWVMGNARGLERLSSLSIASCGALTDLSLEAVGKGCKTLKHLSLRKCCFVSDNGLLAFSRSANSIETLHLEEINRVSQVVGILAHCRMLKSLSLVKCLGIKDLSSLPDLSPETSSLRSLTIQNCPGFGNASLAVISKLCTHLQNLDLTGSWGITDSSLLPLVASISDGLVKVNLSNCLNVTDETVSALTTTHGGTLELLNLDGCRKVTDASLASISGNCLVLSDLDVSKCAVSDLGMADLAAAEQLNLQVLSLSGCSLVSNKSLPVLEKMGSGLVGLNLQNCHSICPAGAEKLSESLWRCDILY